VQGSGGEPYRSNRPIVVEEHTSVEVETRLRRDGRIACVVSTGKWLFKQWPERVLDVVSAEPAPARQARDDVEARIARQVAERAYGAKGGPPVQPREAPGKIGGHVFRRADAAHLADPDEQVIDGLQGQKAVVERPGEFECELARRHRHVGRVRQSGSHLIDGDPFKSPHRTGDHQRHLSVIPV
jgi:hypothetical protein